MCEDAAKGPHLAGILDSRRQERARHPLFARMMRLLPIDMQARLDALLHVEADHRVSPLQLLKEPPGLPSPRALIRLTTNLDYIHDTGVLALDLA